MGKLSDAQKGVASVRSSREQRKAARNELRTQGNELKRLLVRLDSYEGQVIQSIDLVIEAVKEAEERAELTTPEKQKLAAHKDKYIRLRSQASRLADA